MAGERRGWRRPAYSDVVKKRCTVSSGSVLWFARLKMRAPSTWCRGLTTSTSPTCVPNSEIHPLDAGHFAWEQASDEYGRLIVDWVTGGFQRLGGAVTA